MSLTTLHLQPPATARYAATLSWESFAGDAYQLTTIEKEIMLRVQPSGAELAVTFETYSPRLVAPADPEPLVELALRLAALYARVQVQAMRTGTIAGLLNHAEVLRDGNQLLAELRAATLEDDQVTHTLLDFAGRQLQTPTAVLASLQHDYLYQLLLPDFYDQPLGDNLSPRPRQFSNFFNKTPLWFSEHTLVLPAAAPGQLAVRRHGQPDVQKTDVSAVRAHLAEALRLASPGQATPATLPSPHFHYEATYVLEQTTGLPEQATLTVYVRAEQLFNKEYNLTLTQL
jgi:hypothetical protein